MATRVKRSEKKTAFDPVSTFEQHLTVKNEARTLTTRAEALKKRLKEWITTTDQAYEDTRGSLFVDLPGTIEVDGQPYQGMELRRSVSVQFDEEAAEAILKRKKVYEDCLSTYVDQDKVSRAHQEGRLTDNDIDKMFVEKESFAFWPIKGEVLD